MRNLFLIVVLAGVVVLAIGVVVLGSFPPAPHVQAVEKVLPNDKFQTH